MRGIEMSFSFNVYDVTKSEATFVAKNQTMPTGKTATDNVTFQDLIDLGIIAAPTP